MLCPSSLPIMAAHNSKKRILARPRTRGAVADGGDMGFFSRLFQPRPDGQPVADDWTSLPDSQASELVVMGDEAAKLLAEFDIDTAIASHERWVPWLSQVLQGARDEQLRPEIIRDDSCSELGQWLHGNGRIALGHFPAYDMLLRRHRYFHQQAAMMILHAEAGESQLAEQAFKGCQHASRQVVLLLKELKRGLGGRSARSRTPASPVGSR